MQDLCQAHLRDVLPINKQGKSTNKTQIAKAILEFVKAKKIKNEKQ